jgi:chromosome segregation ATPase
LTEKQEVTSNTLTEAGKDITSLRIDSSNHNDKIIEIGETLNSHQSRLEMDESRISTNEVELSAHRNTLDDILRNVNDHQLGIDTLYQTSAFHQTLIEELQSTTRNLDRLPLGTIMSYHPKNAETFPVGWLPCDGENIDKGPLKGQRTPGNPT